MIFSTGVFVRKERKEMRELYRKNRHNEDTKYEKNFNGVTIEKNLSLCVYEIEIVNIIYIYP